VLDFDVDAKLGHWLKWKEINTGRFLGQHTKENIVSIKEEVTTE